jgi:hypothetical protein
MYENQIKPVKNHFKRGEDGVNQEGEFHLSTLYACMEIS